MKKENIGPALIVLVFGLVGLAYLISWLRGGTLPQNPMMGR